MSLTAWRCSQSVQTVKGVKSIKNFQTALSRPLPYGRDGRVGDVRFVLGDLALGDAGGPWARICIVCRATGSFACSHSGDGGLSYPRLSMPR
jgi:hypothetical protein